MSRFGDGLMAGLFVNVGTLGVFVLSGVVATCRQPVHLYISAPKELEALQGSCLQIPCNYTTKNGNANFDNTKAILGLWLKSGENRILNGINTTGNLQEQNCTSLFSNLTEEHTDEYFFRIENEDFKALAVCDGVKITVKDSPWSPRINKSKPDLKENESVTITCSAVAPCPHSPPELTWNLQHDSHTQTEKNNDGTFTTKIQKSITLSDAYDGYNTICSVRYPVNEGKDFKTAQTKQTLNVSYAPKKTSASISPAGTRVNLTCSSRANPPIRSFTWFKKSHHGDVKVAEGDFYSLNERDGGVYYCVAANDLGNQTSPLLFLTEGFQHWGAVLGGIIGIILLLGIVCIMIWWRRMKETNSTKEEIEEQTSGNTEEENIHYGQIRFSKHRHQPSSDSEQESRQELDTVYAHVNVK